MIESEINIEGVDMNRSQTIQILATLKPDLVKRFGVIRLALFDSVVLDETRLDSNIEIIVSFAGAATTKKFSGVLFSLEEALGHPIDLVLENSMCAELRLSIEKEAISV